MPLGPGGLDAEGVYLLGEADLESLASDVLNKPGESISTVLGGLRERLELAEGLHVYRWADSDDRDAETGMRAGDLGYQIDNDSVYRYSGSGWVLWSRPMQAWTPTMSGWTIGTGGSPLVAGRYCVVAGRVEWVLYGRLGTSGYSVGDIRFSLPVNAAAVIPIVAGVTHIGNGVMDAGATYPYAATIVLQSASQAQFRRHLAASSGNTYMPPTGSSDPYAWTAEAKISARGSYEAA